MWISAILTSGRVRPRIAARQAEVNHTLRSSVSDKIRIAPLDRPVDAVCLSRADDGLRSKGKHLPTSSRPIEV
jgi:hypothetical protein